MLTAYFDESGKEKDAYALTVAGAVSSEKEWLHFEREWNVILQENGIKVFHMTDLAASRGEFGGWGRERRAPFVRKLADCVSRRVQFALAVTVVLDAWRTVNEEFLLSEGSTSPYVLAGNLCVRRVREWEKELGMGGPISYVFENGSTENGALSDALKTTNISPTFKPKDIAQLQVADLIAWKNRRLMHDLKATPFKMTREQFNLSLSALGTISTSFRVVDDASLRLLCKSANLPLRQLTKQHQATS